MMFLDAVAGPAPTDTGMVLFFAAIAIVIVAAAIAVIVKCVKSKKK